MVIVGDFWLTSKIFFTPYIFPLSWDSQVTVGNLLLKYFGRGIWQGLAAGGPGNRQLENIYNILQIFKGDISKYLLNVLYRQL